MVEMRKEAMRYYPYRLETGGVLMGYTTKKKNEAVITDIIGPGPKSAHKALNFTPDTEWQNDEVGKIFDKTDGIITYLGDWHTHPDNPTTLSQDDFNALKVIATHKEALCIYPLMLVLGWKNCSGIDVYQYPYITKPLTIKYFNMEG